MQSRYRPAPPYWSLLRPRRFRTFGDLLLVPADPLLDPADLPAADPLDALPVASPGVLAESPLGSLPGFPPGSPPGSLPECALGAPLPHPCPWRGLRRHACLFSRPRDPLLLFRSSYRPLTLPVWVDA